MTEGYKGLQWVTGLQRVTGGYKGLCGGTEGYEGLQRITQNLFCN